MSWRLLLILMISAAIAGCGAGGAAVAPLPYAPAGATWTYLVTETPSGGFPTTSTTTLVYRGVSGYRGSSYQLFEDTNTSSPGITERIYMEWDGSLARIKAELLTDGTTTIELVFDKTWVLNQAAESTSGTVQRYLNGTLVDAIPWSISTSDGGIVGIIVPAGSFTTRRWDGIVNVGGAQPYSSYTSAHTEIKRQFTSVSSGTQVLFELTSGEDLSLTSRPATEATATTLLLRLSDLKKQLRIR